MNDLDLDLHNAAKQGHIQEIEELIERGADVNSQDASNRTPLHFVAELGHLDTVIYLISCDVDINALDILNRTPLHLATLYGRSDISQALIDCGADVHLKDSSNHTPLFYAAYSDSLDTLLALLKNGADAQSFDALGESPLKQAILAYYLYEYNPVERINAVRKIEALMEYGANPENLYHNMQSNIIEDQEYRTRWNIYLDIGMPVTNQLLPYFIDNIDEILSTVITLNPESRWYALSKLKNSILSIENITKSKKKSLLAKLNKSMKLLKNSAIKNIKIKFKTCFKYEVTRLKYNEIAASLDIM